MDSEKFCKIIDTIKSEKKIGKTKQSKFESIGNTLAFLSLIGLTTLFTLKPIIMSASTLTKTLIAFPIFLSFLLLAFHLLLSFFNLVWYLAKNTVFLLIGKASFSLGDPLKNRAKLAEKRFIAPSKKLRQFYKRDLEKFCDWLDYRIKLESIWAIFGLGLLTLAPKIGKSLNVLLDGIASKPDAVIANPLPELKQFIHFEYFVFLIAILILITKIFIPIWMSYLQITKYAINHGYYREA